ncbi:hypothetical protein Btru_059409 [Bulinus truncatus]|nr:hypothetical protein Btru_059409 [Bulinus truncatus]
MDLSLTDSVEKLKINKDIHDFTISSILKALEQHLDSNKLKVLLCGCSSSTLTQWKDIYSLDLLHYCILHSNIVALIVLLNHGCFKPPYKPTTWPYLHMVACLGYTSLISTIVQEINFQNEGHILDWDIYYAYFLPKTKLAPPLIIESSRGEKFTPVDIAGIFEHIGCAELLLDFWQIQKSDSNYQNGLINRRNVSYLTLACTVHSPYALQLLLTKHSEKKEALECSVRSLAPQCLDIILKKMSEVDVKKAFQGMNLFHVLYFYSCCLTAQQYQATVEITRVLIKHGQDVNSLCPSRTFPLYSILCHSLAGISIQECANYLLDTLVLLLKAGADPNVDEIVMEEDSSCSEESCAFGRQPYSSAVNCILSNLPFLKMNEINIPLTVNHVDRYMYKCIKLLLKHGANVNHVGKFISPFHDNSLEEKEYNCGTSLHLMVSIRPFSHLPFSVLQLLLHSGVDADVSGALIMEPYDISIKYAINILPLSLLSIAVAGFYDNMRTELLFSDDDFQCFNYILKFMSHNSVIQAYREFLITIDRLKALARERNILAQVERHQNYEICDPCKNIYWLF